MDKQNTPVLQRLEIESDPTSLARVEGWVDDICESYDIKEDYYGNILIALTEAVNNAIDHGNKRDSKKLVIIDHSEENNRELKFTVRDEGDGFDFNNLPDPTDPENIEKPEGRGIFLMKNLADTVDFDDYGRSVNIKFSL